MATSYSLFWGINPNDYSLQNNRASARRQISRIMRQPGMQLLKAKMVALTGAAPSQAISETRKRATHPTNGALGSSSLDLGGARTYESFDVDAVNTITSGQAVAGDETAIELMLQQDSAPSSYPVDVSGQGGGGKAGI
jgi:hypothetical protein